MYSPWFYLVCSCGRTADVLAGDRAWWPKERVLAAYRCGHPHCRRHPESMTLYIKTDAEALEGARTGPTEHDG